MASSSTKVTIGCKLPNGLVLSHPMDSSKTVTLNGVNKATIKGANYATTEVDSDFWEAWYAMHKDLQAVKSNAIFVAKNAADVVAIAKELKKEKTGLEPMPQEAQGVKKAEKED